MRSSLCLFGVQIAFKWLETTFLFQEDPPSLSLSLKHPLCEAFFHSSIPFLSLSMYLFQRMKQKRKGNEAEIQQQLKTLAMDTLTMLEKGKLITFDDDLYGCTATEIGKIMSKNYISKTTIDHFNEAPPLVRMNR